MDMMNKTQATELFQREAVLFGGRDGIPEERAVKLLGKEEAPKGRARRLSPFSPPAP